MSQFNELVRILEIAKDFTTNENGDLLWKGHSVVTIPEPAPVEVDLNIAVYEQYIGMNGYVFIAVPKIPDIVSYSFKLGYIEAGAEVYPHYTPQVTEDETTITIRYTRNNFQNFQNLPSKFFRIEFETLQGDFIAKFKGTFPYLG